MGWYFRKSIGAGPFRLNLSKSGVGYSFGVRGARIGVGPRGHYVRLGRGGIYYQKFFTPTQDKIAPGTQPLNTPAKPVVEPGVAIVTADVSSLRDSTAEELLNEIREKHRKIRLAPLAAVLLGILVLTLLVNEAPLWIMVLTIVSCAAAHIQLRHLDYHRKTMSLSFELDAGASKHYVELLKSLQTFAGSTRIWRIPSEQRNLDPKYHAGAGTAVDRKLARMLLEPPPFIETRLAIWKLALGTQTLYFLPDRVLVYQSGQVGAVSYQDLRAQVVEMRFAEEEMVPTDSTIVGWTWRYTNRNGGPDRRFSRNRQIPWVGYADVYLQSNSGMNFVLLASSPEKAATFRLALQSYANACRSKLE